MATGIDLYFRAKRKTVAWSVEATFTGTSPGSCLFGLWLLGRARGRTSPQFQLCLELFGRCRLNAREHQCCWMWGLPLIALATGSYSVFGIGDFNYISGQKKISCVDNHLLKMNLLHLAVKLKKGQSSPVGCSFPPVFRTFGISFS